MNEGLEALGSAEQTPEGRFYEGVFERSALEEVVLPGTLRRVFGRAFRGCAALRGVELPAGVESVGEGCFEGSGVQAGGHE